MAFTKLNLHPKILQAIEVCGYNQPTPIQSKAIPCILEGKDIVASAQTGTGKTAAYVLPGLQLLLTKKSTGKPRILILAPTRELASQITKVIGKYGKFAKVNIVSIVGGMPYHKQLRELSRPTDIIIATPGRLMDHMENRRLDLSHIEMLVIDEADRMLDMGFIDDIKTIVKVTPASRQTLLFSATADDKLMSIMQNLLKHPTKINISQEKVDTDLIKQKIHMVSDPSHKSRLLEQLLSTENMFKAIIFSATKRNAAKLALRLRECGYAASPMHGDLKQSARNRTLSQFRTGEVQFLVATDVAARGIDVIDISHVINYDLPKFSEDYVHRIGRTGRAGKTGVAISISLHSEIHQLKKIERYIGNKLQLVQMTQHGEQEWQGSISENEQDTNKRRRRPKRGHHTTPKPTRAKKFGGDYHKSTPKSPYAKRSEDGRPQHSTPKAPHAKRFGGDYNKSTPKSPYAKRSEDGRPHHTTSKPTRAKKFGGDYNKSTPKSPYAKRSEDGRPQHSAPKAPHAKRFGGDYNKSTPKSPYAKRSEDGRPQHSAPKAPHAKRFGGDHNKSTPKSPHAKKSGGSHHRYQKRSEPTR